MTHKPGYRWALTLLRWGLCAVAVWYLYTKVNWHDHIELKDGSKPVLLRESGGAFEVRDASGAVRTVTRDQVKVDPDTGVPDIEYGIARVVRQVDVSQALLAILIFLPVPFLSSQRLIWMLRIQDVPISLWQSIKLTFAGNFFNFALPGTTGGDLIKAYYITRFTHHKTEAVTTVFLDRVVGLLGLMMLATATFVFSRQKIEWNPRMYAGLTSGLLLVWGGLAVGCLIVFSARLRKLFGLSALVSRLPAGQQLLRVGRATVAMRRHKTLLVLSLLITILLQLLVVVSAYVMSLALDMKGGWLLYFICVPIGFLIAAIPISPPQALGVMEYFYIKFFTPNELNTVSQAFAFALAVRLIQLVWALPGVLVLLLGIRLPKHAELERFEEEDEESEAAPPSVPPRPAAPARATSPTS